MTNGATVGAADKTPKRLDNIATYRAALEALAHGPSATSPQALQHKHRAVLALARAGSSDFAQSEYERYGLGAVTGHEDIMSLAGRLAKDRFRASGDIEDARSSAALYEAAFKSTGGYYSGINAATMSLLANVPREIVNDRARAVLARLVSAEDKSPEARYYIEATRAEAHYILGDMRAAAAALQRAADYDPLNYTAHASTYRQFKLLVAGQDTHISEMQSGSRLGWLAGIRPPAAAHYAGHLFEKYEDEARLAVQISDIIQSHDIGFGYGALAAGADIVFAETLLAEGAELHVILPVEVDLFCAQSVAPMGAGWTKRFRHCLKEASSVRAITARQNWPEASLNNYAARIAMGKACARAAELETEAVQVLICDDIKGRSFTAFHGQDWRRASNKLFDKNQNDTNMGDKNISNKNMGWAREQIIIDFAKPNSKSSGSTGRRKAQVEEGGEASPQGYEIITGFARDGEFIAVVDHPLDAMDIAVTAAESAKASCFGLHITALRPDEAPENRPLWGCKTLSKAQLPGSILVSEDMAAILALEAADDWQTGFMGWVCDAGEGDKDESGERLPAYFARPIGV